MSKESNNWYRLDVSPAIISRGKELEIGDGVSVGGNQCEKLEEKLRKGLVTGRSEKFINLELFLVVMKFISDMMK